MRETRYLWVKNLPENIQEDKVADYFKRYGRIEKVKLNPKRYSEDLLSAFVAFVDIRSAQHAQSSLNTLGDQQLHITYSDPAAMSSSSSRCSDRSPLPHPSAHRGHSSSIHRSDSSRPVHGHPTDRSYSGDRYRGSHVSPANYKGSDHSDKTAYKHKSSRGHDAGFYVSPKLERKPLKVDSSKVVKKRQKVQPEEVKPLSKVSKPKDQSVLKQKSSGKRREECSSSEDENDDDDDDDDDVDDTSSSDSDESSEQSTSDSSLSSASSSSRSNSSGSSSSRSSLGSQPSEQKLVTIIIKKLPARPNVNNLRDGIYHEFKKCGKVKSVMIRGDNNCRHALVLFRNATEASKAISHAKTKLLFGAAIEASLYDGEVSGKELQECGGIIDEFHPRASRTLFVGNLDKTVQYSDIKNIFVRFGEIVAIEIKKMYNVPQYAFLQYTDIASVVKAIQKMDGELLGRNVLKLGFGKTVLSSCVWVEGVTDGFTEHYLASCFHKYGSLKRVIIDRSLGQALVFYPKHESAQKAIGNLRGRTLNGSRLKLDFASHELVELFLSRMQSSGQSVTTFESVRHLLLPTPSGTGVPSSNPAQGSRSSRSGSAHPYPGRPDPYYDELHGTHYHGPPHGYDSSLPPRGDWRGGAWDERSRSRPVYQNLSPRGRRYHDDRPEFYQREGEHFDRLPGRYDPDYRGAEYVRREHAHDFHSRPYPDDYHRSVKPRDYHEPHHSHLTPPGRVVARRSRSISPRLSASGRRRGQEFEAKADSRSRDYRDHSLSRGRSPNKSPGPKDARLLPGEYRKFRDHAHASPNSFSRRDDERRVELREPKSLPGSPRSSSGSVRSKVVDDPLERKSGHGWSEQARLEHPRIDDSWPMADYDRSRSETPTRDENSGPLGEVIIKQPTAVVHKPSKPSDSEKAETKLKSETSLKKKKSKLLQSSAKGHDFRETSSGSGDGGGLLQRKYSPSDDQQAKKHKVKQSKESTSEKKYKGAKIKSEGGYVEKPLKKVQKEEKRKKITRVTDSKAYHHEEKLHKPSALIKREYSPSSLEGSGGELKRKERPSSKGSTSSEHRKHWSSENKMRKRQERHSKGGTELSDADEEEALHKKRRHSLTIKDDSDLSASHAGPDFSDGHELKLKRTLSDSHSDDQRSSKRARKTSAKHEAPIPVASQSFMTGLDEESAASIDSDAKEPSSQFRPKVIVREEVIEVDQESDDNGEEIPPPEVTVDAHEERKDRKSRWDPEEAPQGPSNKAKVAIAQPFLTSFQPYPEVLPKQPHPENTEELQEEGNGNQSISTLESTGESVESQEKLSRLEEEKAKLQALLEKLDSKQVLVAEEASQVADVYLTEVAHRCKKKHQAKKEKRHKDDVTAGSPASQPEEMIQEEVVDDAVVPEIAAEQVEIEQDLEAPEIIEEQTIVEEEVSLNEDPVCEEAHSLETATVEIDQTLPTRIEPASHKTESPCFPTEQLKEKHQRSLLRKQKKERERHKRKVARMRGPSQSIVSSIEDEEEEESGSESDETPRQDDLDGTLKSVEEKVEVGEAVRGSDDISDAQRVSPAALNSTSALTSASQAPADHQSAAGDEKVKRVASAEREANDFAKPFLKDTFSPGSTPKSVKTDTASPSIQKVSESSRTSASPFTPMSAHLIDRSSQSSGRSNSLTPPTPSPKTKVHPKGEASSRPPAKQLGNVGRKSVDDRAQHHKGRKSESVKSSQKSDSWKWKQKTPMQPKYYTNLTVSREADISKPLDKKELERLCLEVARVKKELEISQGSYYPSSDAESNIPPMSPILKSPSIESVTPDSYSRAGLSPVISSSPSTFASGCSSSLTERMKLIGKVKKKMKSDESEAVKSRADLAERNSNSANRLKFGNSRFLKSSIFDQDSQRLSHLQASSQSSRPPIFSNFDSCEMPEDKPLFSAIVEKAGTIVAYDESSETAPINSLSKNELSLSSEFNLPAAAERPSAGVAGKQAAASSNTAVAVKTVSDEAASGAAVESDKDVDGSQVVSSLTTALSEEATSDVCSIEQTSTENLLKEPKIEASLPPVESAKSPVETTQSSGLSPSISGNETALEPAGKVQSDPGDAVSSTTRPSVDEPACDRVMGTSDFPPLDGSSDDANGDLNKGQHVPATAPPFDSAVETCDIAMVGSQDSYVSGLSEVVSTEVVDFGSVPDFVEDISVQEVVAEEEQVDDVLMPEVDVSSQETVVVAPSSPVVTELDASTSSLGKTNESKKNENGDDLKSDRQKDKLAFAEENTVVAASGPGQEVAKSFNKSPFPSKTLSEEKSSSISAITAPLADLKTESADSAKTTIESMKIESAVSAKSTSESMKIESADSAKITIESMKIESADSAKNTFGSMRTEIAESAKPTIGSMKAESADSAKTTIGSMRAESADSAKTTLPLSSSDTREKKTTLEKKSKGDKKSKLDREEKKMSHLKEHSSKVSKSLKAGSSKHHIGEKTSEKVAHKKQIKEERPKSTSSKNKPNDGKSDKSGEKTHSSGPTESGGQPSVEKVKKVPVKTADTFHGAKDKHGAAKQHKHSESGSKMLKKSEKKLKTSGGEPEKRMKPIKPDSEKRKDHKPKDAKDDKSGFVQKKSKPDESPKEKQKTSTKKLLEAKDRVRKEKVLSLSKDSPFSSKHDVKLKLKSKQQGKRESSIEPEKKKAKLDAKASSYRSESDDNESEVKRKSFHHEKKSKLGLSQSVDSLRNVSKAAKSKAKPPEQRRGIISSDSESSDNFDNFISTMGGGKSMMVTEKKSTLKSVFAGDEVSSESEPEEPARKELSKGSVKKLGKPTRYDSDRSDQSSQRQVKDVKVKSKRPKEKASPDVEKVRKERHKSPGKLSKLPSKVKKSSKPTPPVKDLDSDDSSHKKTGSKQKKYLYASDSEDSLSGEKNIERSKAFSSPARKKSKDKKQDLTKSKNSNPLLSTHFKKDSKKRSKDVRKMSSSSSSDSCNIPPPSPSSSSLLTVETIKDETVIPSGYILDSLDQPKWSREHPKQDPPPSTQIYTSDSSSDADLEIDEKFPEMSVEDHRKFFGSSGSSDDSDDDARAFVKIASIGKPKPEPKAPEQKEPVKTEAKAKRDNKDPSSSRHSKPSLDSVKTHSKSTSKSSFEQKKEAKTSKHHVASEKRTTEQQQQTLPAKKEDKAAALSELKTKEKADSSQSKSKQQEHQSSQKAFKRGEEKHRKRHQESKPIRSSEQLKHERHQDMGSKEKAIRLHHSEKSKPEKAEKIHHKSDKRLPSSARGGSRERPGKLDVTRVKSEERAKEQRDQSQHSKLFKHKSKDSHHKHSKETLHSERKEQKISKDCKPTRELLKVKDSKAKSSSAAQERNAPVVGLTLPSVKSDRRSPSQLPKRVASEDAKPEPPVLPSIRLDEDAASKSSPSPDQPGRSFFCSDSSDENDDERENKLSIVVDPEEENPDVHERPKGGGISFGLWEEKRNVPLPSPHDTPVIPQKSMFSPSKDDEEQEESPEVLEEQVSKDRFYSEQSSLKSHDASTSKSNNSASEESPSDADVTAFKSEQEQLIKAGDEHRSAEHRQSKESTPTRTKRLSSYEKFQLEQERHLEHINELKKQSQQRDEEAVRSIMGGGDSFSPPHADPVEDEAPEKVSLFSAASPPPPEEQADSTSDSTGSADDSSSDDDAERMEEFGPRSTAEEDELAAALRSIEGFGDFDNASKGDSLSQPSLFQQSVYAKADEPDATVTGSETPEHDPQGAEEAAQAADALLHETTYRAPYREPQPPKDSMNVSDSLSLPTIRDEPESPLHDSPAPVRFPTASSAKKPSPEVPSPAETSKPLGAAQTNQQSSAKSFTETEQLLGGELKRTYDSSANSDKSEVKSSKYDRATALPMPKDARSIDTALASPSKSPSTTKASPAASSTVPSAPFVSTRPFVSLPPPPQHDPPPVAKPANTSGAAALPRDFAPADQQLSAVRRSSHEPDVTSSLPSRPALTPPGVSNVHAKSHLSIGGTNAPSSMSFSAKEPHSTSRFAAVGGAPSSVNPANPPPPRSAPYLGFYPSLGPPGLAEYPRFINNSFLPHASHATLLASRDQHVLSMSKANTVLPPPTTIAHRPMLSELPSPAVTHRPKVPELSSPAASRFPNAPERSSPAIAHPPKVPEFSPSVSHHPKVPEFSPSVSQFPKAPEFSPSVSHHPKVPEFSPSVSHHPKAPEFSPSVSQFPKAPEFSPSVSHHPKAPEFSPSVSQFPKAPEFSPSVSHHPKAPEFSPSVSHHPKAPEFSPSVSQFPKAPEFSPSVSHHPKAPEFSPSVSHHPKAPEFSPSVSHHPKTSEYEPKHLTIHANPTSGYHIPNPPKPDPLPATPSSQTPQAAPIPSSTTQSALNAPTAYPGPARPPVFSPSPAIRGLDPTKQHYNPRSSVSIESSVPAQSQVKAITSQGHVERSGSGDVSQTPAPFPGPTFRHSAPTASSSQDMAKGLASTPASTNAPPVPPQFSTHPPVFYPQSQGLPMFGLPGMHHAAPFRGPPYSGFTVPMHLPHGMSHQQQPHPSYLFQPRPRGSFIDPQEILAAQSRLPHVSETEKLRQHSPIRLTQASSALPKGPVHQDVARSTGHPHEHLTKQVESRPPFAGMSEAAGRQSISMVGDSMSMVDQHFQRSGVRFAPPSPRTSSPMAHYTLARPPAPGHPQYRSPLKVSSSSGSHPPPHFSLPLTSHIYTDVHQRAPHQVREQAPHVVREQTPHPARQQQQQPPHLVREQAPHFIREQAHPPRMQAHSGVPQHDAVISKSSIPHHPNSYHMRELEKSRPHQGAVKSNQAEQQQDSLQDLFQRYPIIWQGKLALKNDFAAVQIHFVAGNMNVGQSSLPKHGDANDETGMAVLRIMQRMRIAAEQMTSLRDRMTIDEDCCLLLALPCGRDKDDVAQQTDSLRTGFIEYLQQKEVAGIVNVDDSRMPQQGRMLVLHVFPPCDFTNSNLHSRAPDLLANVADIQHLLIVVTPAA